MPEKFEDVLAEFKTQIDSLPVEDEYIQHRELVEILTKHGKPHKLKEFEKELYRLMDEIIKNDIPDRKYLYSFVPRFLKAT